MSYRLVVVYKRTIAPLCCFSCLLRPKVVINEVQKATPLSDRSGHLFVLVSDEPKREVASEVCDLPKFGEC